MNNNSRYNKLVQKFKYDKVLYIKALGDFKYLSISDIITFIVNCLVFPAITFQIVKTWKVRETKDFSPSFLALQFFGGAPEGMVGLMLGIIFGNVQLILIGVYAMIMRGFMFFMRLFGKGGLVKPLFK
jgi:hypothetical protein